MTLKITFEIEDTGDVIPDDTPALGLLDDAIAAERWRIRMAGTQ